MAAPCTFSFGAPYYLSFDLSPLRGVQLPYSPTSGYLAGLNYVFSLCATLQNVSPCGKPPNQTSDVSSMQTDAAGGSTCLQSYGVATAVEASVLADGGGLLLTYSAAGSQPDAPFTNFAITCDPSLPPGQLAIDSLTPAPLPDGSNLAYALRAAAGCGASVPRVVAPLGWGWVAFLALAGAAVAYMGGGTLYNRRARGARGLEAVPHIEGMRAGWGWVQGKLWGGQAGGDYENVMGSEEGELGGWGGPPGARVS